MDAEQNEQTPSVLRRCCLCAWVVQRKFEMKQVAIHSEGAVRAQHPNQVSMPSHLRALQMVERGREGLAPEAAPGMHWGAREGKVPALRCWSQAKSSHLCETLGLRRNSGEA